MLFIVRPSGSGGCRHFLISPELQLDDVWLLDEYPEAPNIPPPEFSKLRI